MTDGMSSYRARVLVVEGRPYVAQFVDQIMTDFALIFAEPEDAARILENRHIDVVLLDVALPGNVTTRISDICRGHEVPMVLLTEQPAAMRIPCLVKPFLVTDLRDALRVHVAEA